VIREAAHHAAAAWHAPTLSQTAVRALRATQGVGSVLVAPHQPHYVDDVLPDLARDPSTPAPQTDSRGSVLKEAVNRHRMKLCLKTIFIGSKSSRTNSLSMKKETKMEELINLVAEKSGLPKAQAEKAVNAVLEVLEEKLPAPLASQIKPALENEGVLDNAENMLDKGLNLFGKK
jgi:hypothetical protein